MVAVTLWAGLAALADDQKELEVDAGTIRELLRNLAARYPALRDPIKTEVAVVVDGVIYRNDWSKGIPKDAKVFLMRRLAGG